MLMVYINENGFEFHLTQFSMIVFPKSPPMAAESRLSSSDTRVFN